ncbi:MAG: hypothetical protein FWE71_02300 [Nocardioidaceae bacterium]|nr:hypothetical protein [Nocardioidaceae bacterium]MCL2611617.1 hypothetical protein [Nocardioidaceae bacterium]
MSDDSTPTPPPPYGQPFGQQPSGPQTFAPKLAAPARENVLVGLVAALGAVVGGIVLTVVLWRIGFIAGISSFVIAAGATALYLKGAGAPPKRGLPALLMLIIVGVALSFFAAVASDLWSFYGSHQAQIPLSRTAFIRENLFRGAVLRTYGHNAIFFVIFGALGVFGTMRRLIASAR